MKLPKVKITAIDLNKETIEDIYKCCNEGDQYNTRNNFKPETKYFIKNSNKKEKIPKLLTNLKNNRSLAINYNKITEFSKVDIKKLNKNT